MDTTKSDNLHSPPDDKPEDRIDPEAQAQEPGENPVPAADRPLTLIELIMHIDELIAEGADPQEGIRKLCNRAIAEPGALIEAASTHLSHLINGGELRECPDIPPAFLVEELAHGATLVSPFIVSHWVDTGDFGRLVQLADCLIKRASSMSGADIGAFILYLAVDLAIRQPARSLNLIEIARPLMTEPESDPLVRKATEWQAAGAFLLEGGGRLRKFWQAQLTEGTAISWWKKDAAKAVAHLKKAEAKGKGIPSLLRDAVPPVIWAQIDHRAANEVVDVAEEPSAPAAPEEKEALFSESVPESGWPQAVDAVASEVIEIAVEAPVAAVPEEMEATTLDTIEPSVWPQAADAVADEMVDAPDEPPVGAAPEEKKLSFSDSLTSSAWPQAAGPWADEGAAVVELPSLPTLPEESEETESLFPDTIPPSVWRVAEEDAVIAKSEIVEQLSSPPPPLEATEPLFLDPLPASIWPRVSDEEANVPGEGAEEPFPPPSPEVNLSSFLEPIPSTVWSPEVDDAAGKMLESVVPQPVPPRAKPVVVPAAVPAAMASTAAGEKKKSGLLAGILIGSVTVLAAAAWVWKDAILQATRPHETAVRQNIAPPPSKPAPPDATAENPSPPQAIPPRPATPPEQPIARIEKTETPPPKAPASAVATASVVAMMRPVEDSPPPPAPAKPAPDSPPELPTDAWRKAEFAALAQQFPSLMRWHTVVRTAKWREVRSLIMGTNGAVPSTGDEYPFLIKLLLLDPPLDPEVAEAVPKVAARMTNPTEWIPLFAKLTYPGSPNEKQLRQAAQAYLSASPDFLMPSLMDGLQKLAQPAAKAAP